MGKYQIDFKEPQAVRDTRQLYLQAAFSAIAPNPWKGPIDAMIRNTPEMRELITDAIIHFTGSVPTFHGMEHDSFVRVRATGYYAAVGA